MNYWNDTLDECGLIAHKDNVSKVDMRFAERQDKFYRSRSANELRALVDQAWLCNDASGYMLSRSYLALKV